MRLLVTGSSGLVGRELVHRLRDLGHHIVPFDLTTEAGGAPQDIRDPTAVREAVRGCDGVFHLAAISRVAWGEQDPETCAAINVAATQSLVDILAEEHGGPWLVFTSSREVYGNPENRHVAETDAIAPVNAYGRSKAAGEMIVNAAANAGLRTAILRLSNVYGGLNDHPDRAVPALLWRAIRNERIELTGGDNYFDFVHVRDVAKGLLKASALLAAGEKQLPTVHLATGVPTSLKELARIAIDICRSRSEIALLPYREFDVSGFCGDPALAFEMLGWRADTGLVQGMEDFRDALIARGAALPDVHIPGPYRASA